MTAREWVSFDDPDEDGRRWLLDVTFLTSRWRCLYGDGCPGIRPEQDPDAAEGCCVHGAHFSDAADRDRVVHTARELRPDEWQYRETGRRRGVVARAGSGWRTRRVDDACIFLNRPGFPAGPGCALHLLARRRGVHHVETKPEVCWQLPLRRVDHVEDDGSVLSVIGEFDRAAWGPGGAEFGWWCTEAPEAHTGSEPVYRSLAAELRATVGEKVYAALVEHLEGREQVLPHPAVAPRRGPSRRRRGAP